MRKLINMLILCLVLSTFVIGFATAAPDDSGGKDFGDSGSKDPIDMTKNVRTFLTDWFFEIMLLVIVVVSLCYLLGVLSAQLIARGIKGVGIVIGAIFIFYALPWIATNWF